MPRAGSSAAPWAPDTLGLHLTDLHGPQDRQQHGDAQNRACTHTNHPTPRSLE